MLMLMLIFIYHVHCQYHHRESNAFLKTEHLLLGGFTGEYRVVVPCIILTLFTRLTSAVM